MSSVFSLDQVLVCIEFTTSEYSTTSQCLGTLLGRPGRVKFILWFCLWFCHSVVERALFYNERHSGEGGEPVRKDTSPVKKKTPEGENRQCSVKSLHHVIFQKNMGPFWFRSPPILTWIVDCSSSLPEHHSKVKAHPTPRHMNQLHPYMYTCIQYIKTGPLLALSLYRLTPKILSFTRINKGCIKQPPCPWDTRYPLWVFN